MSNNILDQSVVSVIPAKAEICRKTILSAVNAATAMNLPPSNFSKIILLSVILLIAAVTCVRAAVTVSGHQLIVNGSTFTVKGVCYSPTPVGEGSNYPWWEHPEIYNADFPLIKAMGANTIRTYGIAGANSSAVRSMLDAAYANGLYVIMSQWVDTEYASEASVVRDTFTAMVNQYKDHPAVLMWSLGNEVDEVARDAGNIAVWYSCLNAAAVAAHAQDNAHPVTSAFLSPLNISDTLVPAIDVWSVNAYYGRDFSPLFTSYTSSKPLLISEWGCDTYNVKTSQYDDETQSSYLRNQWTHISQNLSLGNAANPCVGGTVFEWCDEWWKHKGGQLNVHDIAGYWTNVDYPDYIDGSHPNMNEEWWGIVGVMPGSTARTMRPAYYALQSLWTSVVPRNIGSAIFVSDVRNFPNPLIGGQGSTRIRFTVRGTPEITVEIFDLRGTRVREVKTVAVQSDGVREAQWDGKDDDKQLVPAGLYVAKVTVQSGSSEEVKYRKIAVVK